MTLDISGLPPLAKGDRVVTNPAVALSREADEAQKQTVDQLKEAALEAPREESQRVASADESGTAEQQQNADTDSGSPANGGGGPASDHVDIVA